MSPLPGELYLVDLGMVGKVRPAVVVSREDPESPRALAVCVPLTTENRGSAYEVALGKLRFLDKESWVNVQGLMSVGHEK
jgi:mRNA interferase MazF